MLTAAQYMILPCGSTPFCGPLRVRSSFPMTSNQLSRLIKGTCQTTRTMTLRGLHAHDAAHEFIQVAAAAETKRQVARVVDPAACSVTISL